MSAPLTTPDMDTRGLDGFLLNVERALSSETLALTKKHPEAFRAAFCLWCRAWKQVPPASLPNNDEILAAFADVPLVLFRRLRDLIMRGFELCDDGRWYHHTLAEEANRVWPTVLKGRRERAADKERLKLWRERKRSGRETVYETPYNPPDETPYETGSVGIGSEGKGSEVKASSSKDTGSEAAREREGPQLVALMRLLKIAETPAKMLESSRIFGELIASGCTVSQLFDAAEEAAKRGVSVKSLRYISARAAEIRDAARRPVEIEWCNDDDWRARIASSRRNANAWPREWGPRIGEAGCVIPAEIIAEAGACST